MPSEWARFCSAPDLRAVADGIDVRLGGGRHHQVQVTEEPDGWRLSGVVVRAAGLERVASPALKAWERNRSLRLPGFRLDERGRLVGEAWVPKAGVTAEEFQTYVRAVAVECDRFEHTLTGKDVE